MEYKILPCHRDFNDFICVRVTKRKHSHFRFLHASNYVMSVYIHYLHLVPVPTYGDQIYLIFQSK